VPRGQSKLADVTGRRLDARDVGVASVAKVADDQGGVSGSLRGERVERFFRDIHGIESSGRNALVLGRVRRDAAAGTDVSRGYWTVVCADRGGVRPR
jgi:hypothetical protein